MKAPKHAMTLEDDINLLSKIYTSVTEISGVRISQLSYKAAMNNDLHIYGDDVDEIFTEIEKSYPFAWETFPFSHYFVEEGMRFNQLIGVLLRLLFLPIRILFWVHAKKFGPKYYESFISWLDKVDSPYPRTPFTIGHLFAFVKNGSWSESIQIPPNLPEIDNLALNRIKKK